MLLQPALNLGMMPYDSLALALRERRDLDLILDQDQDTMALEVLGSLEDVNGPDCGHKRAC